MALRANLYFKKHHGRERLFVDAPNTKEIQSILRQFPGALWSRGVGQWHFHYSEEVLRSLTVLLANVCQPDIQLVTTHMESARSVKFNLLTSALSQKNSEALKQFKKWMEQQRYGGATITSYLSCLVQFFNFHKSLDFDKLSAKDVSDFNHQVIIKGNLSTSYQRNVVGAIKLFYSRHHETLIDSAELQRPFKEKRLPEILSKEEVQRILNQTDNLKHKAILSITYACGMRRSEVLNLRLSDLDSQRKLIYIRQAKGKKDRCVPFGDKIRDLLVAYYKIYKPKTYLFEGQYGGKYGARSMELILQRSVKKCKLPRPVSLHTLRHSFATHHLESGTDIRYIQEILGHSSPKTTMIYTHVSMKKISEFKSPFDDLDLKK